jgi:hypothetical protein
MLPLSRLFYRHCHHAVNTLPFAVALPSSRLLSLTSRCHHKVHCQSVMPHSIRLFHRHCHCAVHPLPLCCIKPSISIDVPSLQMDITLMVALSIRCHLPSCLSQAIHHRSVALPSQRPSLIHHATLKLSISLLLPLRCPSIAVALRQAVHLHQCPISQN